MNRFVVTALALSVSACGGAGGPGAVSFVQGNAASTGYAKAGDTIANAAPGTKFSAQVSGIRLRSNRSTGVVTSQARNLTGTVEFTDDPQVIFLTINGERHRLDYDVSSDEFSMESSNRLVGVNFLSQLDFSALALLTDLVISGNISTADLAHAVSGYNTDPATLPDLPAAAYSGHSSALVFGTTGDATYYADGDLALQANFAGSEISGDMFLLVDDLNGNSVGTIRVALPSSSIVDNTFAGTASVTNTVPELNLSSAAVQGAFYGNEAQEIGGTFAGSGSASTTSGSVPIKMQGGFLGSK